MPEIVEGGKSESAWEGLCEWLRSRRKNDEEDSLLILGECDC